MRVPLRLLAVTATAVFVSACWPCPTCPPGPTRVVIDFEHYPGPDGKLGTSDDVAPPTSFITTPRNQWASLGVVFTRGSILRDPQGFGARAGFGAYYLSSLPVEGSFSQSENAQAILNLDYLVLTTSPP